MKAGGGRPFPMFVSAIIPATHVRPSFGVLLEGAEGRKNFLPAFACVPKIQKGAKEMFLCPSAPPSTTLKLVRTVWALCWPNAKRC